jgi:hypothetical protein
MRPFPTATILTIAVMVSADSPQSIAAPWATLTTAHYRIHYPAGPGAGFESFAREVASRIEGLHDRIRDLVGHARTEPTDILVRDPHLAANGLTFSPLKRPYIELWRTEPESDSEIAHDRSWAVGLAAHELVHLHHLTWPERRPSPWRYLSYDPLKRSPVASKAPTWLIEGYATHLEGVLTGMGRPHSAFRALVLREWAREGRLPAYDRLSQGDPVVGSAGRYLISSAFVAWLEGGRPQAFPDLWKRLASPRYPAFEGAFKATFGLNPAEAYARFSAELTHSALEMERRIQAGGLREGVAWTRVDGGVRDLSVSPDGAFLLAQVLDGSRPGLAIWDLNADDQRAAEARRRAAERDPDLPPEVASLRPLRAPSRHLGTLQGALPEHPAWRADGTVAYRRRSTDASGAVRLVTERWISGARVQAGRLIPRLWPTKEGEAWVVEAGGRKLALPFEPFGSLAWDGGQLYASTAVQGVLEVVRLPFDRQAVRPFGPLQILTRTASGAAYPAPTPDGKTLFFGLLSATGMRIHRLELDPSAPRFQPWEAEARPFVTGAVQSSPDAPSPLPPPREPPPAHPYRVGESHQWGGRLGVTLSPSDTSYRLGIGGNDFLGRLDWALLGVTGLPGDGAQGPRGFTGGLAWRGWAGSPRLQVFSQFLQPSRMGRPVLGQDLERRGGELALERDWPGPSQGGGLRVALAREDVERVGTTGSWARAAASLEARGRGAFNRGPLTLAAFGTALGLWGSTGGDAWQLQRASVSVRGAYRTDWDLELRGEAGRIQGTPGTLDRFQLGGQALGLLPPTLEAHQVFQPALPLLSATGDRFTRWRAQTLNGLLYLEGTTVWDASRSRPAATRVVGLEIREDTRQVPGSGDLLRRILGSFQLTLGLHRPLDGPMKGRTVGTLALLNRF